jgi:hypothetical protein
MFRFTIRDVLWLMVVVGLGVGWWVSLSRCKKQWKVDHDYLFTAFDKLAEQRRESERLKESVEIKPQNSN